MEPGLRSCDMTARDEINRLCTEAASHLRGEHADATIPVDSPTLSRDSVAYHQPTRGGVLGRIGPRCRWVWD